MLFRPSECFRLILMMALTLIRGNFTGILRVFQTAGSHLTQSTSARVYGFNFLIYTRDYFIVHAHVMCSFIEFKRIIVHYYEKGNV